VSLLLKGVEKLLTERQITLELTPAAQELLLSEGYDPAYGARPLRRTIQRLIRILWRSRFWKAKFCRRSRARGPRRAEGHHAVRTRAGKTTCGRRANLMDRSGASTGRSAYLRKRYDFGLFGPVKRQGAQ